MKKSEIKLENTKKLEGAVAFIEEKLSRELEISVDELRKKTIIITNSQVTIK